MYLCYYFNMVSVWQMEFKDKIRESAQSAIAEDCSDENLRRIISRIHQHIEEQLMPFVPKDEKKRVMCRRGCFHCCRVHVPVLYPEALYIASYLSRTLSKSKLGRFIADMEIFAGDIASYDEEERIAANKPCVFLGEEGECTIHSVRPLACRSVVSADAQACRESLIMTLLDDPVFVPINIKHKSIVDSAFVGLSEALDAHGLDSKSYEITSKVVSLLKG